MMAGELDNNQLLSFEPAAMQYIAALL